MLNVLKALILADMMVLSVCMIWGDMGWIVNSQIGFFSSALILGASMFSYSGMVRRRVAHGEVIFDDDRDDLDKLDDPHGLYDTDEITTPIDTTGDIRNAILEEKEHMKKHRRTIGETLKDSRASMSIFRLGAYALLFVGFLYLSKSATLDITIYLISLSIPMVISVGVLVASQGGEIEENH